VNDFLVSHLSRCLAIWKWADKKKRKRNETDVERLVVTFIALFTTLSTLTSIIQQIHTIIDWRDVKIEQWENETQHLGSPEVAIAGPSVGLDLVLFYIQYYSYNVTALLVLFW
jgi:hypothetical protein